MYSFSYGTRGVNKVKVVTDDPIGFGSPTPPQGKYFLLDPSGPFPLAGRWSSLGGISWPYIQMVFIPHFSFQSYFLEASFAIVSWSFLKVSCFPDSRRK